MPLYHIFSWRIFDALRYGALEAVIAYVNHAEVLAALKARRDEIDKILTEHAAVLPINEVIVHDHGTAVLDIETGKWAK